VTEGEEKESEPDPLIGQRFGDGAIEILKKLGAGGMGTVYLARDEKHDRLVAIKFLKVNAVSRESMERFKREGQVFGALRHENIVRIYGYRRRPDQFYIVSEYVEGRNLYQLIVERGTFEVDEALRIARGVACGLHEVHKHHIVHRDLKPENVMVRDSDGAVKVLDFGIAKDLGASIALTQQGHYIGTPAYSAPEQIRGRDVDHRADIFSLGVILYELLTGKVAFTGRETSDVLKATLATSPIPPSKLNECVTTPVAKLIDRMIQKSARVRPADMNEVVAEIDRVKDALARGFTEEEKRGVQGWLKKVFQG
jgi:eukaryotic-like serine/threonine-protein kinase